MVNTIKQAWGKYRHERRVYHQELRAIAIADMAHSGQLRKKGGLYVYHPLRVAEYIRKNVAGKSIACEAALIQAAILHDTIEDSDGLVTEFTLAVNQLNADAIDAVVALSKNLHDQLSYSEYIEMLASNPIATVVKLADMIDNLADGPSRKQLVKYSKGIQQLLQCSQAFPETESLIRKIFN